MTWKYGWQKLHGRAYKYLERARFVWIFHLNSLSSKKRKRERRNSRNKHGDRHGSYNRDNVETGISPTDHRAENPRAMGLSFTLAQLQISRGDALNTFARAKQVSIPMNIQSAQPETNCNAKYLLLCWISRRLCRNSANLNRFTLKINMPKHPSKWVKY